MPQSSGQICRLALMHVIHRQSNDVEANTKWLGFRLSAYITGLSTRSGYGVVWAQIQPYSPCLSPIVVPSHMNTISIVAKYAFSCSLRHQRIHVDQLACPGLSEGLMGCDRAIVSRHKKKNVSDKNDHRRGRTCNLLINLEMIKS